VIANGVKGVTNRPTPETRVARYMGVCIRIYSGVQRAHNRQILLSASRVTRNRNVFFFFLYYLYGKTKNVYFVFIIDYLVRENNDENATIFIVVNNNNNKYY